MYLSLTMLYILLLKSWYCITAATLSIFFLYTVRFNCARISAACCLFLARHCVLLFSRSAGWLDSLDSYRLQRSKLVVSFCTHQLVRSTRPHQSAFTHLRCLSFWSRLSPAVGYAPDHSSYGSLYLQLAVLIHFFGSIWPAVGHALSCSSTSLSVCLPSRLWC